MKTLFAKEVRGIQFYKMKVGMRGKEKTFGMIWLEDSEFRISIKYGKFYFLNDFGQVSGIVLKSNPAYRKIKRAIAIWFKTYRVNRLTI